MLWPMASPAPCKLSTGSTAAGLMELMARFSAALLTAPCTARLPSVRPLWAAPVSSCPRLYSW